MLGILRHAPSKPGRVDLPLRDFWPRSPKPHDLPCPAEIPRPFRVLALALPGAGLRLPRLIVSSSGAGSPRVAQSKTLALIWEMRELQVEQLRLSGPTGVVSSDATGVASSTNRRRAVSMLFQSTRD